MSRALRWSPLTLVAVGAALTIGLLAVRVATLLVAVAFDPMLLANPVIVLDTYAFDPMLLGLPVIVLGDYAFDPMLLANPTIVMDKE